MKNVFQKNVICHGLFCIKKHRHKCFKCGVYACGNCGIYLNKKFYCNDCGVNKYVFDSWDLLLKEINEMCNPKPKENIIDIKQEKHNIVKN